MLTRRLLLAKQLLTETALPVTEVAFASGFASLRRFNDAFRRRYGMPPTRLRRRAGADGAATSASTLTLRLSYRAPYDWPGVLAFLRARQLAGVEWVTDDAYARTVRLGAHTGWIRVTRAKDGAALSLELAQSLTPALPALLRRVRALFDLEARPDVIARHLRKDRVLAPLVAANPGLRVPGAFDGFEMAVRAILGQQITVKAATTIAGRLDGRARRADRDAARAAHPPVAGAGAPGPRARRRSRGARDPRRALQEPDRARRRARLGRALARRRRAPRSRRHARAPGRAARHRPLDRALHRDARAALARRVSARRRRRARQPRRRHGRRGRRAVAAPGSPGAATPSSICGTGRANLRNLRRRGQVFDLTLPLADVAEAYRAMDTRRAIKTLLRV